MFINPRNIVENFIFLSFQCGMVIAHYHHEEKGCHNVLRHKYKFTEEFEGLSLLVALGSCLVRLQLHPSLNVVQSQTNPLAFKVCVWCSGLVFVKGPQRGMKISQGQRARSQQ